MCGIFFNYNGEDENVIFKVCNVKYTHKIGNSTSTLIRSSKTHHENNYSNRQINLRVDTTTSNIIEHYKFDSKIAKSKMTN